MRIMAVQQAKIVTEVTREYGTQEKELGLDAWPEQVERARRESENAYAGFVDSLILYYRQSMMVAESNTREDESDVG
jgi:hypothetical protein